MMNTIELQNSIIKKILDIKDTQLLKYLQSILDSDTKENIYQLSEDESQFLKESMADYENGNVFKATTSSLAYFGATTDYGLRVDGTQVALAASSVQVYPSNALIGTASNINGYHLNDNILSSTGPTGAMNVRVRNQQVAEVVVVVGSL